MKRKNPEGADAAQASTTLDANVRAELANALEVTPEQHLRKALARLAARNEAIALGLVNELLSASHETGELVPNIAVCAHCENVFDPSSKREEDECVFHEADLMLNYDSDVWIDDDHPEANEHDKNMQREFPEGYLWECCDKIGTAKGCSKGIHEVKRNKRARQ